MKCQGQFFTIFYVWSHTFLTCYCRLPRQKKFRDDIGARWYRCCRVRWFRSGKIITSQGDIKVNWLKRGLKQKSGWLSLNWARSRQINPYLEPFLIIIIDRIGEVIVDPVRGRNLFGTESICERYKNNIIQLRVNISHISVLCLYRLQDMILIPIVSAEGKMNAGNA